MDRILQAPIVEEKKAIKTLAVFMLLFCLLPILLNIACLAPIYSVLYSNVRFQGTALPEIIRYVMDLFDIIAFSSAYALLIYSFIFYKKKAKIFITLSYIGILLLKMPLKLLVEQILNHSITDSTDLIKNLILLLFYFVIELLQFSVVFNITYIVSKNYLRAINILSNDKKRNQSKKIESILPIKKFVNRDNPLLRIGLYSAITVVVFRVLTQLITDIELGAPESFQMALILIVLYLTNIIYGVITYFVSIFIYNFTYKHTKEKANLTDTASKKEKLNKKRKKDEADEKNSSAPSDEILS